MYMYIRRGNITTENISEITTDAFAREDTIFEIYF